MIFSSNKTCVRKKILDAYIESSPIQTILSALEITRSAKKARGLYRRSGITPRPEVFLSLRNIMINSIYYKSYYFSIFYQKICSIFQLKRNFLQLLLYHWIYILQIQLLKYQFQLLIIYEHYLNLLRHQLQL